MVNSSWTAGHIAQLWWRWQPPTIVYPPCDTKSLQVNFLRVPKQAAQPCAPECLLLKGPCTSYLMWGNCLNAPREQHAVGLRWVPTTAACCSLRVVLTACNMSIL